MSWKFRRGLYLACTFAEAVAVIGVRRTRRLLGLRPRPHPTDAFLGVFLRHALGRERQLRITCAERTDGAGAQAHTIMSAMCFARAQGHTYVHTPFAQIDHAERPMDAWVDAWEQLFNLGEGETPNAPAGPPPINYSTFHPRLYHAVHDFLERPAGRAAPPASRARQQERHFHPFFYFSDCHPDAYCQVIPEFRRKYYRDSSPVGNRIISIAIHLRRGDITPAHRQRFTPNALVLETTGRVRALLEKHGQEYAISLYALGAPGDFAEFRDSGVELFLNVDAVWTMRQLIEADVLIMSRSSFSYVAALISDGLKLYEPFWHSPLPGWLTLNRRGRFDERTFETQLAGLIRSRLPEVSRPASPARP
jgi:hypothetical protein